MASTLSMSSDKRRTILLAEDNPAAVLLVERAFRRGNINLSLQVVVNGQEAIDYLIGVGVYGDRVRYPLPVALMTNIKMPQVSGFELLTWVRAQSMFQQLPVIVISSSELDSDSNRAYALGAYSYLVKPVGVESLLRVFQALNLTQLPVSDSISNGTDCT